MIFYDSTIGTGKGFEKLKGEEVWPDREAIRTISRAAQSAQQVSKRARERFHPLD